MGRHYLLSGVTVDKRLTSSPQSIRSEKTAQDGYVGSLLNRKSDLSVRNGGLLYRQLICPHDGLCMPRVEVRCSPLCPEAIRVTIQVHSPCYWCRLVRKEQENTQGSGYSDVCRPHQSPDCDL
jgi:hypothetical protein